jgi:SIR2-like domain
VKRHDKSCDCGRDRPDRYSPRHRTAQDHSCRARGRARHGQARAVVSWRGSREAGGTFSDSTAKIKVDDGQIIFGIPYKLQYVDPFLYLMYQLRRLCLEAKLLLVVGYGFGDEHINGISRQALRGSADKRLIAVTWFGEIRDEGELRLSGWKKMIHGWSSKYRRQKSSLGRS